MMLLCNGIIFLLVAVRSQINSSGCTFDSVQGIATCDFTSWKPPLNDSQFGLGGVNEIIVKNVNGVIQDKAFIGMNGPRNPNGGRRPTISFQCNLEDIILYMDTFSSNLDWVRTLTFNNCYIRNGLSSNMLHNLKHLEELKITSGIVGPLTDKSFAGLSSLKILSINSDFLNHVPPSGLFLPLISVEVVDLRTSGVSSLSSGSFHGLRKLKTIDLSRNSLTTLPTGLFKSLSSLQTVKLSTNNWHCTCNMAWISTWSLYSGISIDIICSEPSSVFGLNLNMALLSLGCSSLQQAEDKTDDYSISSENSTFKQYAYIATGLAGLACVISGILSCVLCYMCYSVKHIHSDITKPEHIYKSRNQRTPRVSAVNHDASQSDDTLLDSMMLRRHQISRQLDNPRPPSYQRAERLEVPSPDRLFIPSPKLPRQKMKDGPYIDVIYSTDF